ncbi:hypothetical protein K501DRAFT_244499 [Backusella circina FSU 941]|nr:hypothetical protein K501DRAFT_244499 [Backusella circina FSU 941]
MATYITYVITVIFIFIIIIQLNTYLAFIQLPSAIEKDPTVSTIVHERYKRDYTVLLYYTITALLAASLLLIRSHLRQKRLQSRSQLQRKKLLNREWRIFNSTFTLKQCLSLTLLIAFNGAFLFSQVTISKDDDQLYFQELANRCAQLAIVNCALTVTLSAKLSIIQKHFYALPDTIHWHQWMGRLAFLEVLFHGTFQLQRNYRRQEGDILMTLTTNVRYFTGTSMLLGMMVLVFGAHPLVRQVSYRLFRISHIASFATLVLMGVLHHWCFSLFYAAVLLFWVLDQVDRFYITEVVSLEALPGHIVRLRVKVPYHVQRLLPGQFVSMSFSSSFVKSLVYSHSFSICKIENSVKEMEEEDNDDLETIDSSHHHQLLDTHNNNKIFTFYIKANGTQTQALYEVASSSSAMERISKLRISQPLGLPLLGCKYQDFDRILIVAEGIGITPWLSLLQCLSSSRACIDIIWTIRKMDTYYAFENELKAYLTLFQDDHRLGIQVYLTGGDAEFNTMETDYAIQFHAMRPDYRLVLKEIQGRTLLAVCAHEDTTVLTSNIALEHAWTVHSERFEL